MSVVNSFEFVLPTRIKYGEGVVGEIADVVKELGDKKPLIVTDKGLIAAGIVDRITAVLEANNVEYTVFDGIEPNPRDTTVHKAYEQAKADGNDSLIAVGGGSSMDTAKAVGVLMTNGGKVNDYEGLDMFKNPICHLIAVPTTCGTGSEVTFWSVITDTQRHFKMSLGSPKCAATVALVDPDMVASLPASVIAATGMDALSHAIEGYTCRVAEPITDACGIYAIRMIGENIRAAVYTDSKEAKDNMLLASLIAGICFGNSDIAGIHCMGEALGGLYDTPHGVTMAMLLPYVSEYNYVADYKKYAEIARALGENVDRLPIRDAAAKSVDALHKLCRDLCIPTMKEIGAKESDLEELARRAAVNVSVDSNPRKADENDFLAIFKKAFN